MRRRLMLAFFLFLLLLLFAQKSVTSSEVPNYITAVEKNEETSFHNVRDPFISRENCRFLTMNRDFRNQN
ncbi:hypothetical protein CROQUDRAFT_651803 [Cronartium quercuum f. sp. fusiforme G11]|uniref:Uncharacterized protein n=1 Tax=Cronartium quercuum f. sp. fusiforme G11 TaxID=708437 RepID=A0A9P6TFR5_9BASI|nr:hypothetical protein CROQUDRAFT_651803 [Cronartium quercuum f. sp. fusiforme G11]